MRFKCVVLLVAFVTAHGIGRAEQGVPAEPSHFHLFLLVGQSNMAGRGQVDPQDQEPNARVLTLDQSGAWVPAIDPLHFDKPKIVGVGLGRTFALDYVKHHPNVTVGLIPCAVGGSPISAWEPGGYHASTKTHPYDDAMPRAKLALESGTLKSILWHQGESDSKPGLADVYEQKLHALIERFRQQLDAPNVPFIAGQMGQFEERPWSDTRKTVDAAHRGLPAKVQHTGFVKSDGLSHKGDEVHFDSASYRTMGHRYFSVYQSIVDDQKSSSLQYEIKTSVAHQGFDGKTCWVHARAGVIPPSSDNQSAAPTVVMTTQQLLLSGSDVFYALHSTQTKDLGGSWSPLRRHDSFARRGDDRGREVTVCDFTPKWHAATRRLLGTGHTVWYEDNRVMHVRSRETAYAVFDSSSEKWSEWKRLKLPERPEFANAGAGSVQRYDLANGEILLPIYFKRPEDRQYSTTVCRCSFDGHTLKYLEHGSELTIDVKRGLYEPSITKFAGRYYLTMRNDDHGYVSVGDDGLQFEPPRKWTFDDGTDLGNYNTQQHWVTHSDRLFLVYTRKGADNDHVFRHCAPLFIAAVDPDALQVVRATERVLVAERGARLGNFGVVAISPNETWVTASEWMQPAGVEKHGSDNSIFVAKLKWSRPNANVAGGSRVSQ